jgi:uncharacterized protein
MSDILQPSKRLRTLEELMERDQQREDDGFSKKIKLGQIIKPGIAPIIVPSVEEEKFYHYNNPKNEEEGEEGGTADSNSEEGDILGHVPVDQEGEGEGQDGQGGEGEGDHGEESENAYNIGKYLTEKFELPELQDKGKKRSLIKFKYDLTDSNKGTGQILDKKRTMKNIIKTNIGLGKIDHKNKFNMKDLLIDPRSFQYRCLSREADYENEAVVFFIRDYSGSMYGKRTEIVVTLHSLLYFWLMYAYKGNVETRFILHDTEAIEVNNFTTYYRKQVAGGTEVTSAVKLVNEIVYNESLEKDKNIYVFMGSDGDDWSNTDEVEKVDSITEMLRYSNRMGFTCVQSTSRYSKLIPEYLNFLDNYKANNNPNNLILTELFEDAQDNELIECIKDLLEVV